MSALIVAKSLFIFFAVAFVFAPLVIWLERRQSIVMQDRTGVDGAETAGGRLFGLFQPLTDGLALLLEENIVAGGANRVLHLLAPAFAAVLALIGFAVIPYGGTYTLGATTFSLVAADVDWGVLYVLAIGALAAHAGVLAGRSSDGRQSSELGGIRSVAQTISVDVTLGLTLVPMVLLFGTLKLTEMGDAQDATFPLFGWLTQLGAPVPPAAVDFLLSFRLPAWGVFLQPVAFVMFLTCVMAQSRRPVFDAAQGGSALVAGYQTGYSGMRFGLFAMSEFVQVVTIAGLVTAIFFGGWTIPYVPQDVVIGFVARFLGEEFAMLVCIALHVGVFSAKMCFVIWLEMLIRWSLPRLRTEQIMNLCWKVILPLAVANTFATALVLLAMRGSA